MTRPPLTMFILLFAINAFGQKKIVGEYQTNFPTYGMFDKTLKLNCDSIAVLNFRGDLMNDNSFGRWKIENKILTVIFDTTKSINSRYKYTLNFKIKGNRLYLVGWTKELYQTYKTMIDQHNKDTGENVQMPKFKKFDSQQSQTPKNFYGKTGTQFFKKTKPYGCDR